MSPLTSPDDHSPVKPPCSIEFNKMIEDSDSNIDNAQGIISDVAMLIDDINDKHVSINCIDLNYGNIWNL